MEKHLLSFDCGNSTLRAILCTYDGKKITSETILSEPNEMLKVGDYFYWDMLHIYAFMKHGLEAACSKTKVDSCGVCTWGIDFMLFDEKENMLSNALSYRNTIGAEELNKVQEIEQKEMFNRTGILCDRINTIYTLKGMQTRFPSIMKNAGKILMVPDVLTYFMTGVMANEPSELSTSQMVDVRDMSISKEQCEFAGIKESTFSRIAKHGEVIGNVKKEILEELKIDYDIPFICTPSHDTASAVFGVPCPDEEYLFISAGTWALIGAQINKPIISDEVREGLLTNEQGAYGKTTLLKNSIGMFITQQLKAECQRDVGHKLSWDEYTNQANDFKGEVKTFDVNHPDFFNPNNMAKAIWSHLHPGDENYSWPEIVASVNASMALSYCVGVKAVMKATGRNDNVLYIVGGGSKNVYMNQQCANMLKLKVVTCDMECSSVGNAAVQLSGVCPELTYQELKNIICSSLVTKEYIPQ